MRRARRSAEACKNEASTPIARLAGRRRQKRVFSRLRSHHQLRYPLQHLASRDVRRQAFADYGREDAEVFLPESRYESAACFAEAGDRYAEAQNAHQRILGLADAQLFERFNEMLAGEICWNRKKQRLGGEAEMRPRLTCLN